MIPPLIKNGGNGMEYNIRDFGAVGNGVSIDTAAILRLLTPITKMNPV